MFSDKNTNFVVFFPLIFFLLQCTCALSDPTIHDLFPQASKYFEEKFYGGSKPTIWNRWTVEPVCKRDLFERVKICKLILELVKSTALTLATEKTAITEEETKCVDLPVRFEWLSDKDVMVHAYRCPFKFSLDSPFYAVGGLDAKSAGFYLVQGKERDAIFVLHDVMKNEDESVQQTEVQLSEDAINETDTASKGAEITNTEPTLPGTEFAKNKFYKILADTDRKLYVSRVFNVEKIIVDDTTDYKIVEVPDFSKLLKMSVPA